MVSEQAEKDRELGALVRRMPKDSKLLHSSSGTWAFLRPGSGTDGFPDPEGALHGLRETFAERWLRHYEAENLLASVGELHDYAKREAGK